PAILPVAAQLHVGGEAPPPCLVGGRAAELGVDGGVPAAGEPGDVVAGAADEAVPAAHVVGYELVVPGAAVEAVGAVAIVRPLGPVAASPRERVVALAEQGVVAAAALEAVGAVGPAEQEVRTVPADEDVAALAAVDVGL